MTEALLAEDGETARGQARLLRPWVGNDAEILWIDEDPVVVVVFTGHHRRTSQELNQAVGRIGEVVVEHYSGDSSSQAGKE